MFLPMKRSIPLVAAGLSIVVAPWPALRANPA
ncbi:MAG TPA: PA-phosphatase, partial [Synechococcales bacterium UBA8647]|nr:PA-phosphatase [Synechococcales bacterium UBA8647]